MTLLEAAKLALAEWEDWVCSELDGTSRLKDNLAKMEPVRKAIAEAESQGGN